MDDIRIKRGQSLNLRLDFRQHGVVMDVGHVTLSAEVRAADDTLVEVLQLIKQPTLGRVTIQVPDTSRWPLGRLRCDLRAVIAGVTVYSKTFGILTARQVTQS